MKTIKILLIAAGLLGSIQAPSVYARDSSYVDAPSAGEFAFYGWEDSWGRGLAVETIGKASGALGADYTGSPFNDEMSSFEICNNSPDTYSYYVRLWKDQKFSNLIYTNTIVVESDQCRTFNIVDINDQVTSIGISPTKQ